MVTKQSIHPTRLSSFEYDMPDIKDSVWFNKCVHYLNDAILVTEAEQLDSPGPRILWANKVFYTSTGYEPSDIIGQSPRILQGPLTDKSTLQTLRKSLDKCEVCRVEVLNYKKDGSTFWNEFEVTPVINEVGYCTHFIAIQRDITERKNFEFKRNKAYSLLKNAEELAHIGSWEWEIKKDRFSMSDEWLRIHGIKNKHISMDELMPIAHPDDVAAVKQAFLNALNSLSNYEITHRIIRQDNGEVRFIYAKGIVSFDKQGKPDKILGTTQDITEKVASEKTLKESEARFRALFEKSPFGTILCETLEDESGKVVDYRHNLANQSAISHLGIEEDEFIGKTALEIKDSKQIKELIEKLDSMFLSNESFSFIDNTSIEDKSLQITAFPLNGKQFILNFIDITERKEAEKELEIYRYNLEAIVQDRTHELTEVNGKLKAEIVRRKKVEGELIEREAVLAEAQRIANLGSWKVDIPSDHVVWSTELFKIFGFEKTDSPPLYSAHHKLFTKDSWNKLAKALIENRGTKTPLELELKILRKDGTNGWVLLRGQASYNEHGTIVAAHGVALDITERKRAEEELKRSAHYDVLTNLPNRVLLADRLKQGIVQCQRRKRSLAVAFIDLDGFKAINDKYGHSVGDELLIAVSKRMSEALREGDTLARIGGDEFVAGMVDLENNDDSGPLLERLLKAASSPVTVDNEVMQVSASIGIAFYPQDGVEAEQLIRQADQAMYVAKQAGRNRYHRFDVAQDNEAKIQLKSIVNIHLAIQRNEFVLHYQPKVNMRDGEVVGVEALIRWQHPEHGLIRPLEFIASINSHTLSLQIGDWVIDTALSQMRQWQRMGLNLPVSVNVSAYQLQQDDFTKHLADILALYSDVEPRCLTLEILETSALSDISRVSKTMEACRALGVHFALDDFGTGYSSLNHLRHLPVNLIKIDQSFVHNMLDNTDDLAIVKSIIGLANAFQREVIAEGVGTKAQVATLLELGCNFAQGYGIAPPMPACDIPDWVANWQIDAYW